MGNRVESEQREWLAQLFEGLTTEVVVSSPSEWAERVRYLPPSTTNLPGYYRFSVAPYLREPLDCLSTESPIREVVVMKGVQICATVGILENALGYYIEHVKTAPVMMVTADAELAKLRLESNITPMIQASGLDHLIKSSDETNTRKTGKTDKKIEWVGGGFLIPLGAQNANKLRSISIRVLLRDEIDGWPDVVGKDGDPLRLSWARTAAFEDSRKILDLSTPTIRGFSKIETRFKQGDQRYYYVCCLRCGFPQVLRWHREDPKTGVISGIVWDTNDGQLVPGSVRYLCQNCQHEHTNDDKTRLLDPAHGAEWRPTATPVSPEIRSYHISALYSPVGMQTWEAQVLQYLEAWDVERRQPREAEKYQVWYNNILGATYELKGMRLTFEEVSPHRRREYAFGEVPNKWAAEVCGSPILLIVCTVDVHKSNLAVAVWGWCRDLRVFLLDYWRFEGDTEQLDDAGTWGRLRELLEEHEYKGDDGATYRVELTLIDSGYRTDDVYQFCSDYSRGVYPVKGREAPPKSAAAREFSAFSTPLGLTGYLITVDLYKDRWSSILKRPWPEMSLQPAGFFNAPGDTTDHQLRELTVEVKREKVDKVTGKRLGWLWHRPAGAKNELWDLLVYANAALDLLAWNVCCGQLEMPEVDWKTFWDVCEQQQPFFSPPS